MGTKIWAVAAVSVLALATAARADAPTVRDLPRIVRLADPHVSPDGKTVALVESRADLDDDVYKSEIFLVDLASHAERQFTRREHATSPAWSPDGASLAFLAPDKDKHLQIFIASMSGGDARQLTHAKESVGQFAWRPDGKAFAYVALDEAPELKGEAKHDKIFKVGHVDFTTDEAQRPSHLWVIDLDGGDAKRLTQGAWSLPTSLPPGPPASPVKWTRDGKSILIVRQESPDSGDQDKARIQVVDATSGAVRDLTGGMNLEGYPLPSPDGKSVAYWRNREGKLWTYQDVWLAPLNGGAGLDISAKGLDRNVYGTQWSRDGQSLVVGGNTDATVGLWRLPLDGQATRIELGDLTPQNGYWMAYDQTPGDGLVVVASSIDHPAELYLVNKGAASVRLTHDNDWVDKLALARTEVVTWSSGGRTINGVLTYPADYKPGTKAPLVLFIHGGPNSSSKHQFNLMPQVMAAKGLMVFEPNYRGSDNMDGAYFASIYKDAGQGPGEDVMAGVEMLKKRGLVDPHRMAVTGWSYGGFMTTWLAGHYPVWKAAVAGAPVTDWRLMYDLSDGNVGIIGATGVSPYVAGGFDANWKQSPASAQTRITAPMLIMTDTGDFRVPPMQAYSLYRALEDNHVETELYAIPVGGHFPSDPIQSMSVYDKWIGWVSKRLQ